MKKVLLVIILFILLAIHFLASCAPKVVDDPLIIPPNFADAPDPLNPEKPSDQHKDADIAKLKDLLLKSE